MTLQQSTEWALEALKAGDMGGFARAIEARRAAINDALASRNPPPPHVLAEIIEVGNRLAIALQARRRELSLDLARLQHIESLYRGAFYGALYRSDPRRTRINVRG